MESRTINLHNFGACENPFFQQVYFCLYSFVTSTPVGHSFFRSCAYFLLQSESQIERSSHNILVQYKSHFKTLNN